MVSKSIFTSLELSGKAWRSDEPKSEELPDDLFTAA